MNKKELNWINAKVKLGEMIDLARFFSPTNCKKDDQVGFLRQ